jgi:hypothetical protein
VSLSSAGYKPDHHRVQSFPRRVLTTAGCPALRGPGKIMRMADAPNALILSPVRVPISRLVWPVLGGAGFLGIPLFIVMAQGALEEDELLGRSLWVALIATVLFVSLPVAGLLGWFALGNAVIRLTVTETEVIDRNRWGRVRRMRITDIEEMVTGHVTFGTASQNWLVFSAGAGRRPIQVNLVRWHQRDYKLLLEDLDVEPEEVGDLGSQVNRRRFPKLRIPMRAGHENIYYTLWGIAVIAYIAVVVNVAFRI